MKIQLDLKEKIVSAVRRYSNSLIGGREVEDDIAAVIAATSPLPLSNMAYWERLISWEFSYPFHADPKLITWQDSSTLEKWIALANSNGYRREKALRALTGAAPNSFFFALAVRRLNDWVPQIRNAAAEILPLVAQSSDPAHVVDALFLILPHWSSWGRIEESNREVVHKIISMDKIFDNLKSGLMSGTAGPLSSIIGQVGRRPVLDHYLDELARNAVQPSVRAKAYRSQLQGKMVWLERKEWQWTDIRYCLGRRNAVLSERNLTTTSPFPETLKKASFDPSPVVRRIAVDFLIRELESLGDDALQLANHFALDAMPSIARRGKFALKELTGQ